MALLEARFTDALQVNRARWLTEERELSAAGEVADANGAVMFWRVRGRDFFERDVSAGDSRACACEAFVDHEETAVGERFAVRVGIAGDEGDDVASVVGSDSFEHVSRGNTGLKGICERSSDGERGEAEIGVLRSGDGARDVERGIGLEGDRDARCGAAI